MTQPKSKKQPRRRSYCSLHDKELKSGELCPECLKPKFIEERTAMAKQMNEEIQRRTEHRTKLVNWHRREMNVCIDLLNNAQSQDAMSQENIDTARSKLEACLSIDNTRNVECILEKGEVPK
jgi:hypothetical protein